MRGIHFIQHHPCKKFQTIKSQSRRLYFYACIEYFTVDRFMVCLVKLLYPKPAAKTKTNVTGKLMVRLFVKVSVALRSSMSRSTRFRYLYK